MQKNGATRSRPVVTSCYFVCTLYTDRYVYWLEDESQPNADSETGARAEEATQPVVRNCEGYTLTEGVDLFRAKCDLFESRCASPALAPFTLGYALRSHPACRQRKHAT